MIKYRKIIAFITALLLCFPMLSSCAAPKSDEEMIEARINKFLKAYNTGDMDSAVECADAKTRNIFKSAMGLTKTLVGSIPTVGGVMGNINMSDLFGLGVSMYEGDILTVDIQQINIQDDTNATVDVTMEYQNNGYSGEAFFIMLKEDGDWYIRDLQTK